MTAFGTGPLLLCSAGLVVLCLLRTPLRVIGALLIGVAAVLMMRAPQPDVMVAADGSAVAIRGEDGRLAMVQIRQRRFAWREWLAADADARNPKDPTLGEGIRCDARRLRRPLARRRVRRHRESDRSLRGGLPPRRVGGERPRMRRPNCAALVIDRESGGAPAPWRYSAYGDSFEITPTRPPGYDRPWARATVPAGDAPDQAVTLRRGAQRRHATQTIWMQD